MGLSKEEVIVEVEAVRSVYGDDCILIDKYPPHFNLHLKPRTADVSSQQFVEAVIGIRAGSQYPDEPPHISIIDSKGLDEQSQRHLVTGLHKKSCELSSYTMLVALCEEAVEMLSSMNHPDGDCPLCLCPLVEEDASNKFPFMKLMSCFHCFHCECIIRWWNWLQTQNEKQPVDLSGVSAPARLSRDVENQQGIHGTTQESMGRCPVCRMIFQANDIEHVLDLVGTRSELSSEEIDGNETKKLIQSDSENARRHKFEAILKLQEENSGLIEPKKNEVLLPGMFLPRPITFPQAVSDQEPSEQQNRDEAVNFVTNSSGSSNGPSSSEQHKHWRKHRGRNPRKPAKQWIRKESGNTN